MTHPQRNNNPKQTPTPHLTLPHSKPPNTRPHPTSCQHPTSTVWPRAAAQHTLLLLTAYENAQLTQSCRVVCNNSCHAGESEFRELSADESLLLRAAADGAHPLPVSAFDPVLLQQLYRKGLVYLVIPIAPDDRFSIPPLEVSDWRRGRGGGGVCRVHMVTIGSQFSVKGMSMFQS